MADNGHLRRPL